MKWGKSLRYIRSFRRGTYLLSLDQLEAASLDDPAQDDVAQKDDAQDDVDDSVE